MKSLINLVKSVAVAAAVVAGATSLANAQDIKFFTIGTGGTAIHTIPLVV